MKGLAWNKRSFWVMKANGQNIKLMNLFISRTIISVVVNKTEMGRKEQNCLCLPMWNLWNLLRNLQHFDEMLIMNIKISEKSWINWVECTVYISAVVVYSVQLWAELLYKSSLSAISVSWVLILIMKASPWARHLKN